MSAPPEILVVVTSHGQMGASGKPTGYWLGEVTHFHEPVAKAGYEIDVVSPLGGKPPLDPRSVSARDKVSKAFTADPALAAKLEETLDPGSVDPDRYAAIYYAGGHGGDVGPPRRREHRGDRHPNAGRRQTCVSRLSRLGGVDQYAGLDAQPLIAGHRVTGFANLEERLLRLTEVVPFLLEDELRSRGAIYTKARVPFVSHVASSGRIITGQNPQLAAWARRSSPSSLPSEDHHPIVHPAAAGSSPSPHLLGSHPAALKRRTREHGCSP
jgi:putative intracellular protease/amidase